MNDVAYSTTSNAIRVELDQAILKDLIYGDTDDREIRDAKERVEFERNCSLREHQVYRLMRSVVNQLNTRLKGRREHFKLVDEGDGLILEFSS